VTAGETANTYVLPVCAVLSGRLLLQCSMVVTVVTFTKSKQSPQMT